MYQRSGLPWTKYWDFILLDMLSMVLAMVAAGCLMQLISLVCFMKGAG